MVDACLGKRRNRFLQQRDYRKEEEQNMANNKREAERECAVDSSPGLRNKKDLIEQTVFVERYFGLA